MTSAFRALERGLGHRPDPLWPAIDALGRNAVPEAKLGGDHHLAPIGAKAFPSSSSFVNGP